MIADSDAKSESITFIAMMRLKIYKILKIILKLNQIGKKNYINRKNSKDEIINKLLKIRSKRINCFLMIKLN